MMDKITHSFDEEDMRIIKNKTLHLDNIKKGCSFSKIGVRRKFYLIQTERIDFLSG